MKTKAPNGWSSGIGLNEPVDLQPPVLRGEAALEAGHLAKLAMGLAGGFPDRVFGTRKGRQSAEWLAEQMKRAGLKPGANGSYIQEFKYPIGNEMWPGNNVVGLLEGSDPKLKHEYIIVSAHHDSQEGTHLGANDNASGCAVVLALAQAFAKNPPKRSILFVTFDGEEALHFQGKNQPGRRGSKYYAQDPVVPLSQTALMVNSDMIAQPHLESGPRNQIYQWSSKDSFAKAVLDAASKKTVRPGEEAVDGYPEQHPQAQMFTTDAEPLYRLGVPIVNFLSGRDLNNHMPSDDSTRLIPERMAQYARLAYQCVAEAGSQEKTLADMGIVPGGLMPSYTMVRVQKSAGLGTPEEEALRLNDLSARLPDFKGATQRLLRGIVKQPVIELAGEGWAQIVAHNPNLLKEPVLHQVRELRNALVEELRDIDKNKVADRKKLLPKVEALSGIEDILQGGIYLDKIGDRGGYYLQQVPARLADLLRGARRLGLEAKLDGIVLETDVTAFATVVSADRAIGIAREALSGLGRALSAATLAVIDGQEAARTERPVNEADLRELKQALIEAGEALFGQDAKGPERMAMVRAMLNAQIGGLTGGTDQKLLEKLASKNRFTDFGELIAELNLDKKTEADLITKAGKLSAAIESGKGLSAAVLDYYGALTALALGEAGKVRTLDDLRRVARRDGLDEMFGQLQEQQGEAQVQAVKAAAKQHPELAELAAKADLVAATLTLSKSFDAKDGRVQPDVSLETLRRQIEDVSKAAQKTAGGQGVAVELEFWSRWLAEYIPLEGRAREQAKARTAAFNKAQPTLPAIWKELVADIAGTAGVTEDMALSPHRTRVHLELRLKQARFGDKDRPAEILFKKLEPYFWAEGALLTLRDQASPMAIQGLGVAIERLSDQLGDATVAKLKAACKDLTRLHAYEDVQMGRKERGGPLGVLAVRAIQQRVKE